MPALPEASGVQAHGFRLGPPLSAATVADFELRHEVELPSAYRTFLTEVGDGGAGPGHYLPRLADSCGARCRPGHLALVSPYRPGPRYLDDWQQRHEQPHGPDRVFLPGTIRVAGHGCSWFTQLIVTGPARGRLFNLDEEGPAGPYVLEDADFLAWYERWLDEVVAGFDVGCFGERLPLDEPQLIAVLADDPAPARRARAGMSLLRQPTVSDAAWTALARAVNTDTDPTVRAEVLIELAGQGRDPRRRPDPATAATEQVARYARSCTPPGLAALSALRRLTLDDLLPELGQHEGERRRKAAYLLAWDFGGIRREAPRDVLDSVVGRLVDDPDPVLRSHAVAAVRNLGLVHLHPLLHDRSEQEDDPWVLDRLRWCLRSDLPRSTAPSPGAPPAVAVAWDPNPPF